MIDGCQTGEIFDRLGEKHRVAYATIRKDVVEIGKAHRADIDRATELEGRCRYLASVRSLRIKALDAGNLKLVHTLNQEIARIFGVNLKVDDKSLNLSVEKAKEGREKAMMAVFSVVTDSSTQEEIIKALEAGAID